jgi:VanZ family protein
MYAIYFKLSPLVGHPSMRTFAAVEHVIAFALFGGLFSFAYPNRVVFVCAVVFVTAVMLEYLQTLTPDRHGTILDACQKIAGGWLGVLAARAILWWHPHDRVGPHSG